MTDKGNIDHYNIPIMVLYMIIYIHTLGIGYLDNKITKLL